MFTKITLDDLNNDPSYMVILRNHIAMALINPSIDADSDFDKLVKALEVKGLDVSYLHKIPMFVDSFKFISDALSDDEIFDKIVIGVFNRDRVKELLAYSNRMLELIEKATSNQDSSNDVTS